MTQTDPPIAGSEQPVHVDAERPARGYRGPALWLGIAAVLASALSFQSFIVIVLGVLLGVTALVLALIARRRGQRGAALGWALALGAVGTAVNAVLVIITLVLVFGNIPNSVELQAEGGPEFTVTFSDDFEEHSEVWSDSWFGKFNTQESSTEITVTPSTEGAGQTHSCRILWNDRVVSEETSDSGQVTCRYESGLFG